MNLLYSNSVSKFHKISSLTVCRKKIAVKPVAMGSTAIFLFVTDFGNLFPSLTFFLDIFHGTFGNELIVCPETACLMQGIRQFVTFI